jgi:hypothetical protein
MKAEIVIAKHNVHTRLCGRVKVAAKSTRILIQHRLRTPVALVEEVTCNWAWGSRLDRSIDYPRRIHDPVTSIELTFENYDAFAILCKTCM